MSGKRHRERQLSVVAKNTTQCSQPGLQPEQLAPESSALTMRPSPSTGVDTVNTEGNSLTKETEFPEINHHQFLHRPGQFYMLLIIPYHFYCCCNYFICCLLVTYSRSTSALLVAIVRLTHQIKYVSMYDVSAVIDYTK